LQAKLAADFPGEAGFRRVLADIYNDLGASLRDGKQFIEAEKAIREAIALGEKVAAEQPENPQHLINLAASYHNLGNVVRDQGDAKGGLAWYNKAATQLLPFKPRPADAVLILRNVSWDRANALSLLGRHADAAKQWQNAALLDVGPSKDHLLCFLSATQMELKLQEPSQPAGELLYEAAGVYARATAAAKEADESGQQERYAKRALKLLEQAHAAGWFRDPKRVQQLQKDGDFNSLPPADFQAFLASLEAGTRDRNDKD
jgi:hypothetical protein